MNEFYYHALILMVNNCLATFACLAAHTSCMKRDSEAECLDGYFLDYNI